MPVKLCKNGNYRIGSGDCIYETKEKAEKAYRAYLAKKHSNEIKELREKLVQEQKSLEKIKEMLHKEKEWIKNGS